MPLRKSCFQTYAIVSDIFSYLKLAQEPGAQVRSLKKMWALETLDRLEVSLKVGGDSSRSERGPLLICGNHMSYLDIVILMALVPDSSFVAKAELQAWPVFGKGAELLETIFVKREAGSSRRQARRAISKGLEEGKKICLFPAGTTTLDESVPWRRGAFEIAFETGAPMQFFRLKYSPAREVAYIGKDFFPLHLFRLAGFAEGGYQAEIEFSPVTFIQNPHEDCERWWRWSRGEWSAHSHKTESHSEDQRAFESRLHPQRGQIVES